MKSTDFPLFFDSIVWEIENNFYVVQERKISLIHQVSDNEFHFFSKMNFVAVLNPSGKLFFRDRFFATSKEAHENIESVKLELEQKIRIERIDKHSRYIQELKQFGYEVTLKDLIQ